MTVVRLPCFNMPKHDLLKNGFHGFIIKLVDSNAVEMAQKPWCNWIPAAT